MKDISVVINKIKTALYGSALYFIPVSYYFCQSGTENKRQALRISCVM